MTAAVTVTRGAGDRDGGEIAVPLLGAHLPALLARGTAELDASAHQTTRVTLEMDLNLQVLPGDLAEVADPDIGAIWRGQVIAIRHDALNGTTTLDLEREQ